MWLLYALFFEELLNCFPKQLYHFKFPPTVYENFNFSTSLLILVNVHIFSLKSNDCEVYLIRLMICISLMTDESEKLFVCFMCRFLYKHNSQINLVNTPRRTIVEICVKTMVSLSLFNQMNMIQIATDICGTTPTCYILCHLAIC